MFRKIVKHYLLTLLIVILYNEYFIYYKSLLQCNWPQFQDIDYSNHHEINPVRSIIIADIHMLGPYRGHWADKLRREWQMHRSYQTALYLFNPEIVFILGDLFDEGQWVNSEEFRAYVQRFQRLFKTPPETTVYGVAGNHDVGFHYKMQPFLLQRFKSLYKNRDLTGVSLITHRGVNFIFINSMAMEQDGCEFCAKAKYDMQQISKQLKQMSTRPNYTRPIVMQHFPTYRKSDKNCIEHDYIEFETYREKWEVLSQESTRLIGHLFEPRLFFSGHSHNLCRLKENMIAVEEYTVPSFNWRNKNNPKLLLAKFTTNQYAVSVCSMPEESTVCNIYIFAFLLPIIIVFYQKLQHRLRRI